MYYTKAIMSNIRGIWRSYPLMFIVVATILSISYNLYSLMFLIVLVITTSLLNKFVTKPSMLELFKLFNLENVAMRPDGCVNSSNFINEFEPNKISTSYGMPSGHSLEAMLISAFLCMYIIRTQEATYKRNINLVLVLLVGISISYSRVILGCHTHSQVIVGGLLGAIIGYYGYILWERWERMDVFEK